MVILLWAHVLALPLVAFAYAAPFAHALFEGAVVAAFAVPATLMRGSRRRLRALIVTFGLLTCSATLVHITGGAIEAHFHYFVVVTILALYEDWTAYIVAIAYVLFQHGLGSAFAQDSIFAHDGQVWAWSAVHAGFIAALCVANVVNWRAAEAMRRELQAHADDLERSNRELEDFAYIASHDLAEPLRTITSYLELIERRVELDDDSRQFFGFAKGGARRMRRLIDDLLRYSRTGSVELRREPVASSTIVDAAMRALAAELDATGAEVRVGDLPVVEGDPALLVQLFQNLVGNAVKFRDEETPRVEVSARELPGSWEFTVKDNGIGVPERHAEQVFKMFQRLHGRDKYDGTGIGLSVCQRIVERHGGRIRVEPGEDGGSRFVFTLAQRERV